MARLKKSQRAPALKRNRPSKRHPAQLDFRKFLYLLWQHLMLPEPTPIQYDLAHYLQHGPDRCIIEAFRGVGKSWLTAGFVVWLLWNDPQLKILAVSASKERADQFATFVKQIIADFPLVSILQTRRGQRDSKLAFDVGPARADHSPSVKSAGITGQITGSRADVIIPDDVEIPNNSLTQTQRDLLAERVKEFDAILKPGIGKRIIYLGTPQTEMSLYTLLPERGYEVRVWPALYPTMSQFDGYKGALAPFITRALEKNPKLVGKTTEPARFTDDDLNKRRASYGKAGFALQFMLDTSLADVDRYPLKLRDLIVLACSTELAPIKLAWASGPDQLLADLTSTGLTGDRYYRPMWHSPEMAPYHATVMAIDPSGRGKDETGYAVVKNLFSNLFLTAAGGLKGGYDDKTLETLVKIAKYQGVNTIVVESNFGDGMFTKLLANAMVKHGYRCNIEEVRSRTQKEKRIIDTLEPVLAQHRLVVDPGVIERDYDDTRNDPAYGLFYQLTRITSEAGALAHDDRLDALSMAVEFWQESMSRDQDKAVEDFKTKELEASLRGFLGHAAGSLFPDKGQQPLPSSQRGMLGSNRGMAVARPTDAMRHPKR